MGKQVAVTYLPTNTAYLAGCFSWATLSSVMKCIFVLRWRGIFANSEETLYSSDGGGEVLIVVADALVLDCV